MIPGQNETVLKFSSFINSIYEINEHKEYSMTYIKFHARGGESLNRRYLKQKLLNTKLLVICLVFCSCFEHVVIY